MAFHLLLLALIVHLAGPATPPAVTLTVSPRFSASSAQDIRLLVRLDPDPRNRLLILVLDGPEYRRSDKELEGADAPHLFEEWFKSVRAPGDYVVQAIVLRAGGEKQMDQQTFCMVGPDHGC